MKTKKILKNENRKKNTQAPITEKEKKRKQNKNKKISPILLCILQLRSPPRRPKGRQEGNVNAT